MNFRQIKQEHGLTLVELLATISLLGVVIVLSSTVIFQLLGNNESTSNQVNITQEANVLISDLRKQFEQENDKLCLNSNKDSFSIALIEGEEVTYDSDGCLENTGDSVSLVLTSGNFSVETTFTKQSDFVKSIVLKEEYTEYSSLDQCKYEDSVEFTSKIKTGNGNNQCTYTFGKNVKFTMGLEMGTHAEFDVKGNAVIEDSFHMDNKSKLSVDGNLTIGDKFSQQGGFGTICVSGDLVNAKEFSTVEAGSCLETHKNSYYDIILIR